MLHVEHIAGMLTETHKFREPVGAPPSPAYAEASDRAAGVRPVENWHLPDAGHTAAIRQAAPEYERRVAAFFDRALAAR